MGPDLEINSILFYSITIFNNTEDLNRCRVSVHLFSGIHAVSWRHNFLVREIAHGSAQEFYAVFELTRRLTKLDVICIFF